MMTSNEYRVDRNLCPAASAIYMASCLKQALRDWRAISEDEESDFTVKWIENRAIEIFRERTSVLVNGRG